MRKITSLFMFAMVVLVWTSCEEDKDDPKVVTKTDLLTAHTWKMTGFKVDPPIQMEDGSMVSDFFALDACYQDNAITFSANGDNKSYSESEGTNNCFPEDPATSSGTWSLNSTETVLTIDPEDETASDLTIEELTENNLKVRMPIQIGKYNGTVYVSYSK